ncbi:hypothetical protein GCM10027168_30900 [Streptomyces capparidis]
MVEGDLGDAVLGVEPGGGLHAPLHRARAPDLPHSRGGEDSVERPAAADAADEGGPGHTDDFRQVGQGQIGCFPVGVGQVADYHLPDLFQLFLFRRHAMSLHLLLSKHKCQYQP